MISELKGNKNDLILLRVELVWKKKKREKIPISKTSHSHL